MILWNIKIGESIAMAVSSIRTLMPRCMVQVTQATQLAQMERRAMWSIMHRQRMILHVSISIRLQLASADFHLGGKLLTFTLADLYRTVRTQKFTWNEDGTPNFPKALNGPFPVPKGQN